jgi:hypothetical protein
MFGDIRERDMQEKFIGKRDIRESDICEPVGNGQFALLMLVHYDSRDVSGSVHFSQS